MSCVIYKGREKLFVDAAALDGMLAQGWSTTPNEDTPPPSAEEYGEFLNLHEELKRVSDAALSARDAQIKDLTELYEQLTEDNEILTAENLELRERFVNAQDQLKAVKEELASLRKEQPIVLEVVDEYERHEAEIVRPDFRNMKVTELKDEASRAGIPYYGKMNKNQLIKALENGFATTNQG